MFTFDLLTPWIAFLATLIPLLMVQRWVHRHLFGVGYLVSREKWTATLLYYLILLPGVMLHEISHYLVAGMFGVPLESFRFWPHSQEDGWLEMGFVELEYIKNPVFAAIVGIAPLVTGILTVVLISNSILGLPLFFKQLSTGEINDIATAVSTLFNKPDFFFWAYILFAVANAMMPNKEDRVGWWLAAGAFVVVLIFLTIIGLGIVVVNWLTGPVAQALAALSAVFLTVLLVDLGFAALIWVIEAILGRVTGHRVEYSPHSLTAGVTNAAPARTFRSVYELALPIPPLPGKVPAPAAPRLQAEQRPALGAPSRPALSTGSTPAVRPEESRPKAPGMPARPGAQSASALSGLGSRPSPLNQPSKPADEDEEEVVPAKPAATSTPSSPFGKPAAPAGGQPPRTFGSPAAPSRPAASKADEDEDEEEAAPAKPASPFGKPAATPAPSSPFGKPATPGGQPGQAPRPGGVFGGPAQPARPAASKADDEDEVAPAKPASPFGKPAAPSGPSSPFGKPAAPATSSPFGKPATPSAQPGQPPRPGGGFGSPAQPARPAASKADEDEVAPSKPASPFGKPAAPAGPSSPFGKPAAPAASSPFGKPATPGGQSGQAPRPGGAFGGPAKPPVSGPPAIARPNSPVPGKPTLPVPADRPATPAPKSPFGAAPRPVEKPKDDDYIDAEYVDEDEGAPFMDDVDKPPAGGAKPGNPFGAPPKKSGDADEDEGGDPKYIPLDEA